MVKKILLGVAIALVLLFAVFFVFIFPSYNSFLKTETVQFDRNLTIVLEVVATVDFSYRQRSSSYRYQNEQTC